MDPRSQSSSFDSIVLSGMGCATSLPCASEPYLKVPKNRKFMGGQDHLAICAAGKALESAGLDSSALALNAGLFLAVGYIPFERDDIEALISASLDGERISLRRFGTDGFAAVNPLLTFRCLPNMPAYHVSACFDIRGEYFVTYPGAGQFYTALQEAIDALVAGRIRIALVGSVADQTNFLVAHHYERLRLPVPAADLRDGAGFLILESAVQHTARRGPVRGRILDLGCAYSPQDPFNEAAKPSEVFRGCPTPEGYFGAASLPIALAISRCGRINHELRSRDGITAQSSWEIA